MVNGVVVLLNPRHLANIISLLCPRHFKCVCVWGGGGGGGGAGGVEWGGEGI